MQEYKNPIVIRHNHVNCPLPLTLESYWNCDADCIHCMGRKLNQIWGKEQRVTNPEKVKSHLIKILNSKPSANPITKALQLKKAIWLGRKSDPYQTIDIEKKVTRELVKTLIELDWSFVICSRYITEALRDEDLFLNPKSKMVFLMELTPGGDSDWEIFEHKRTTRPEKRLRIIKNWMSKGINCGVRGEPFIPGYHTEEQFRDTLKRLRSFGIKSYNTYNLHMNEYTLKRMHAIGIDIEKIWRHNQDDLWRPIQQKLCQIADEENIILGCPDFVNTPKGWIQKTNTCCGVDVKNSFKFNTHVWKRALQIGNISKDNLISRTWEGLGNQKDLDLAEQILFGRKNKDVYTMEDAQL